METKNIKAGHFDPMGKLTVETGHEDISGSVEAEFKHGFDISKEGTRRTLVPERSEATLHNPKI